jgi:cytidine deaminase
LTDSLIAAARAAQARAYAPYSKFRVGAALQAVDGSIFSGCNVENASFGLTICAERAAICAAVTAGAKRFRRAVVVSDVDPPAAPCGACRQVLAEFGLDLPIEGVGTHRTVTWQLSELLPVAFGPEQLR